MKADAFAYVVNQTPKIVAVFRLTNLPPVAVRCGLTKEDVFYYAGEGTFVRTSTYSRFNLPVSSLRFEGYYCWTGAKLINMHHITTS